MFNKPKDRPIPTPMSEAKPMRPSSSSAPSLIGSDIKVVGNITTPGEVHLEGVIEGDISCGMLTVGEHGIVTGTVKADTITLRGAIEGKLRAKTAHFERTAKINGDVTYETMTMEAGVQIDGKLIPMKKREITQGKSAAPARPEKPDTAASKPGNGNGDNASGKPLI